MYFEFKNFSCWLKDVIDLSKSEFEKKFVNVFNVKEGWEHLQTLKKQQKKTSKK